MSQKQEMLDVLNRAEPILGNLKESPPKRVPRNGRQMKSNYEDWEEETREWRRDCKGFAELTEEARWFFEKQGEFSWHTLDSMKLLVSSISYLRRKYDV